MKCITIDIFIKSVQDKIAQFKENCSTDEEYYNELKTAKNKLNEITINTSEFQRKIFNIVFQLMDFELKRLESIRKMEAV